ncbi:e3 binding domain [Rubrobacter radiotolerans]|uniref:E3 binding domain n=1 Tax=Rubrobacter radiotolerans TaxID=42256 RepID=A0A023X4G3_RUBRA|nr:E3 binding domain-containing protein [Rubrobacter radiotolerans]AHY47367.1 e3 binding domain [Rubrobacter radiotolerans]MDX5894771.1 E3 binding domain-containing protein [Rubrobacter radiotolerans]SMC06735.1 polyhydroxyalkanoic acid synthase, PhaR subunit [Rubrobacter radiotolerans DSM 5868]
MSERAGMSGIDPADLWRQWYEMGTRMWQAPSGGGASQVDPWGLYRQWFEGMESVREQTVQAMQDGLGMKNRLPGVDNEQAAQTWRKAVDATVEGWQRSADLTNEMLSLAPRWQETVERARDNLLALEKFPTDPLEFAVQWYNATSGPYSDFVQELIEREEFLAPASQFLQNYASLYKVFSKNSEEYLRSIQVPTRSDITRVASLVVALEEKVDGIEEAFEDLQDAQRESGGSGAVPDGRIEAIERRLENVERKLDRVISAIEANGTGAAATSAPAAASANGTAGNAGTPDGEIRATDAARRKARDLGVDLAEVNGTGADGQITVEDVRRKGEA